MSAPLRQRDWGGALFGSLRHYRRSWLAEPDRHPLKVHPTVQSALAAIESELTPRAGDEPATDS